MSDQKSLKKRIQAGESIRVVRVPIDATRSYLEDILSRGACDLFYVDCQHGPFNEIELRRLCNTAEELGIPFEVRIKHPRQAYLLGNYLDLGPLSLMVPLVEDEKTAIEAINSFYFPPCIIYSPMNTAILNDCHNKYASTTYLSAVPKSNTNNRKYIMRR